MRQVIKYFGGLLAIICLIFLDQITKYWALNYLKDPIEVIPKVFEFHYLENTGAAFGLLENKIPFFIISTILVLIIIAYFYIKTPYAKKYIPIYIVILLLTSGAIGNFIDRVHLNYVIDFLYFKLIDFPIFNVADCYVTIASILLILLIFFKYKEEELEVYFKKEKKIKNDTSRTK